MSTCGWPCYTQITFTAPPPTNGGNPIRASVIGFHRQSQMSLLRLLTTAAVMNGKPLRMPEACRNHTRPSAGRPRQPHRLAPLSAGEPSSVLKSGEGNAMAIASLVSVEEYLHSTFEHDAEYVEGRIVPRPMPQKPHSKMQSYLDRTLYHAGHPLGYEVWPEQRVRTQRNPPRYRVPDLCVTQGEPAEDIFTEPPYLCVEILSPDDTAVDLRAKVHEYLAFGRGLRLDRGPHQRHRRNPYAGRDRAGARR